MIYIFSNKPQQIWQNDYLQTYIEFLPQIAPVTVLDANQESFNRLKDVCTESDFVWITHYKDIGAYAWGDLKAKTIFRISGTSLHPWCYQVDVTQEAVDFSVIDYMLSPHPYVTDLVKPITVNKVITTGYPMIHPRIRYDLPNTPWKHRDDRVVIGGRLSPDKQPMLAMWLLQDIAKGKDVVFCYGDNKELDWLESYGGVHRWEQLGFKFQQCNHLEFLEVLAQSKYYFSCSLGDTMCYSAFEAISLGCYAILPDTYGKGTRLPHIGAMINKVGIYSAFDKSSVEHVFNNSDTNFKEQRQKTLWTDPNRFIARLRDGLFNTNTYEILYGEK